MKKIILIIVALFPSIAYSQTIEFDTTCFCSSIILKPNAKGYYVIETFPEYPGGSNSLKKLIELNASFLETDNGRLLIYFTINCEGETCGHHIKVLEGNFAEVTQQNVLSSLSKMQKWKPGRQNNKIVDVRFSGVLNVINGKME